MLDRFRQHAIRVLSVVLCLFTLAEVNYPHLTPQSQLATFALLGLALCYLHYPAHPRLKGSRWAGILDLVLALASAVCCGYVAIQNEPVFESWWSGGRSLGDRAGAETGLDFLVGAVGLLLVLEAARRAVGLALPILSVAFLAYGALGPSMPSWLFPHRGYGFERLVGQSFLHSQGVFGVALKVMFTYVFLFVVFGAFLEATGATRFIIDAARRLFGSSAGGPAKVSVLSSGLMGSLSGSAVANTATTGTFTIPLMRSAGFPRHVAAGIEAAASSGGALVPPVMGAGAYMMLELVQPPVTYLRIIQAALLPAILYYLSLFLIVHFRARGLAAEGAAGAREPSDDGAQAEPMSFFQLEGLVFLASLGTLIALLLSGFTVFRSVSLALVVTILVSALRADIRMTPRRILEAFEKAARGGIALVAAAASVGIVIGVVTLTGVGSKLPATIIPLAQDNLFAALCLIMVSSIVLGMGLPSAVCYLLLATLIGPALSGLGVPPLAAHLFIFYFGLMSMVTPPVALAAYTAASISGSRIMRTAFAAFRFALVGFALPFLFVYRPELLMMSADGGPASFAAITAAFAFAAAGIVPFAAAIAGHLWRPLGPVSRLLLFAAALGLFYPASRGSIGALALGWPNLAGAALLAGVLVWERVRRKSTP
ncbi:MAG: TRAP transporter fused permease subunit [bacterium]|nr:TRAP transporter fused permease subunit [bacterium]